MELNYFNIENVKNKILVGNSLELLKKIPNNSIDVIITDPPYFLDKLDNNWNVKKINTNKPYSIVIKSLPPGMKFDKNQSYQLYNWFFEISKELLRVLKPGGFFFSFSSPRLYHRITTAIEDAGFLIKDCFIWLYTQNQPKAMSLNHFIDKMNLSESEKNELKIKFHNWKTPQLKSCFEPIVMAQKECEGTFIENMIKYKTGLINTNIKIGEDKFPSNIITSIKNKNPLLDKYFLVQKPSISEKLSFNHHKTVKPISILKYLIDLTTYDTNSIVLDPFIGSGSTAIACILSERNYIGIDINEEYVKIANKRIEYYFNLFQKLKQSSQNQLPLD